MKSGFVNLFGKPNAGKSTLMNSLMGEKLAIISHKVQTTRHRIKGIITAPGYQLILSDTPGIIDPKYKLHEKMMDSVKQAIVDSDLALLIMDGKDNLEENDGVFLHLNLKVPAIVVVNKSDKMKAEEIEEAKVYFKSKNIAGRFYLYPLSKKLILKSFWTALLNICRRVNLFLTVKK